MCTGTLPFQGDSPSDIMVHHINVAPKPPILINPDISPALSAIILHSLEKNPRMRFPNATDMAAALAEVLGPRSKGLTLPASPKTAVQLPLQPPTPKTIVRLPLQHSTNYGPAISSQPAASISSRDWKPGSSPETGGIPRYGPEPTTSNLDTVTSHASSCTGEHGRGKPSYYYTYDTAPSYASSCDGTSSFSVTIYT